MTSMKNDILHIKSITQLHKLCGFDSPKHPLISIIDTSKWEVGDDWLGLKTVADMYLIALKDKSCGIDYGRHSYDFEGGVLVFSAPQQVITPTKTQKLNEVQGWTIVFHPDLIRHTPLGETIDDYNFFSYQVREALHLSDTEQHIITNCAEMIHSEIQERIDNHSQTVIASTLELMLNYCNRFYERQFNTRSAQNSDIMLQFDRLLKAYYRDGLLAERGIPQISYFAERVNLSANYLSDLLKKETGYGAKEHINNYIVDKAKTRLLNQTETISELAYSLGFNYPHYFSRLFKSKTGVTPQAYRNLN